MNITKNIPLVILILILSAVDHCNAQDSTLFLSPKMFNKSQAIWLNDYNVWLYQKGNDPAWANLKLITSGWEHRTPRQITEKMADANGVIEGWFRIRIKADSSLATIPLYLFFQSGNVAADLYIDGRLFHSYGNTGIDGSSFKSYTFYNSVRQISKIDLANRTEHTIAIHFVSHLPSPLLRILINPGELGMAVEITGPQFVNDLSYNRTYSPQYGLFWISVSATLAFLFWLLAFQNRGEKNLWLIALCSTSFCAAAIIMNSIDNVNLSFGAALLFVALRELSGYIVCALILFILARIFTNKIPRQLIIVVVSIFISGIISITGNSNFAMVIAFLATLFTGLYYVISSWKRLKGAQWAIVTGFLCVLAFLVWAGINIALYNNPNNNVLTAVFLSFQISMLVYVSIQFREIIMEVRNNAQKVVEITEEKRQQALNQQSILQQEVDRQTLDLRKSLQNLKSAQAQLIQSEKMASLGELTAGIAHEIQNPLNFVNNFSEVNTELIGELQQEVDKGNYEDVKAIANDIKENEEKINHHGKRAGDIVKGMLQHSRSSTGVREPTNINALADEYLRLSYHGLRAKDKNFNAEMITDFDESIGKINIIPQDIGRVLLNLYNNAFYAVNEEKRKNFISYEPTVTVTTRKVENHVLITVSDNGNGIPQKIVDKIFQPFFTTKPTGQGTGLGLSLSYDIVKAHGGELKVETNEGQGSIFIIQIPIKA